ALDDRSRVLAREEARIGSDLALLAGAAIESREERSLVRAGEEDVHVLRVGRDVARLAAADRVERLDAAAASASAAAPQAVVARIGDDVRVVERALTDISSRIHQLPRRAGIVGAEEAAVFVLDQRVDAVRVGARDGDADLADHALRQAWVARDLAPGVAA